MIIDEFEFLVVSYTHEEELVAEAWNDSLVFISVRISDEGKPIVRIGPALASEVGAWSMDYSTFRKIVTELDDFLVSIGYPPDEQKGDET